MAGKGGTPKPDMRAEFVRAKAAELAEYMVTQGWHHGHTGGVLLGLAAGWVARECGNDVAYQALDVARAAIEQHKTTTN